MIKPKSQISSSNNGKNLGPDMGIYGDRQRQLEETERLKKQQIPDREVKKMTEEERLQKVKEMQDYAKRMDEDKNMKLFGTKTIPEKDNSVNDEVKEGKKDAKFLRDLGK